MTSETKTQPDDRTKLEAAVSKVARAYQELVRLIENSKVEDKDVTNSFNFLARVHTDTRAKAELSIRTALAANGGFSLDQEYQPLNAPLAHPKPTVRQPAPDRLVGQGHTNPGRVAADDDVGFIED